MIHLTEKSGGIQTRHMDEWGGRGGGGGATGSMCLQSKGWVEKVSRTLQSNVSHDS